MDAERSGIRGECLRSGKRHVSGGDRPADADKGRGEGDPNVKDQKSAAPKSSRGRRRDGKGPLGKKKKREEGSDIPRLWPALDRAEGDHA